MDKHADVAKFVLAYDLLPLFPIGTISVYWIVKPLESFYLTGSIRRGGKRLL